MIGKDNGGVLTKKRRLGPMNHSLVQWPKVVFLPRTSSLIHELVIDPRTKGGVLSASVVFETFEI